MPREPFDTFLNARERDMEDEPPEDREAFLSYARGTGGAIQRLAARVLGAADERTLAVAEQVGTAWAITGLLRAVAFHAAQNRVYLPAADLVGRGIDASTVAAGKHHDAIADVAGELAGEARARLMEARKHRQHIEQCALPALLPAILADGYLKRLQRLRWNVYHPDLGRIDGRPLRLTAAVFLNRY